MKQRINPKGFRDTFEISMSAFSDKVGYSRQNLFQVFRGEHGCQEADYMTSILRGYSEKIYKRDVEAAESRKAKAEEIILQIKENSKSSRTKI